MKTDRDRLREAGKAFELSQGYVELNQVLMREGSARILVPLMVAEAMSGDELARQELALRQKPQQEDEPRTGLRWDDDRGTTKVEKRRRAETSVQEVLWAGFERERTRSRRVSRYPVFRTQEALNLHRRLSLNGKDDAPRLQQIYDRLVAKGHLREIARPKGNALADLARTQPHMASIVDFVLDQIELARLAGKPARLRPMLITGEPGIGKTHFAQCLAEALAAPISIQRLDTDQTSALLMGSDRKWGNTQHGLLFELLALGGVANPVIVLDEIDKINRIEQNVQTSLYSVLEPVSASCVRDISVDFELDASLVTWIATANTSSRLDEALRSRFKEFHIAVPSAEQCLVIAREVMLASLRTWAPRSFSQDTNRLERDLAHLPARQIQQATCEAIAAAVKAQRRQLDRQDLPSWIPDLESRQLTTPVLH